MADSREFVCTVVTPERVVLDQRVHFVAVPAHDGEIGFLRGRAPIVSKLDVGTLRADTADGVEELFIDGGFAEMVHNRLTILTEDAKRREELDRDEVLAQRKQALEQAMVSDEAFAERQRALRRARTKLKMLGG